MEIVEIIPPYLYSVKYDDERTDEYHRVFHNWHEIEYLVEFFRFNKEYLEQPFWRDYFPEPEDAAKDVVVDATALENYINQLADNANNGNEPDFDTYFHPLDGKYIYEWHLVPMKGYGIGKPSFLRLYAIRLSKNCYLLVFGGLKLADTIQNSPGLKTEVFKRIDLTLAYMKREGITEQEDLREKSL
ncbi:MAG: hypothetical protein J5658_03350 [Prevotella sp.]|nr:hypothetical protein [Prevotella sp.]